MAAAIPGPGLRRPGKRRPVAPGIAEASRSPMFRRRVPLPTYRRILELVWPRAGWHRASAYLGHRLGRLPGTPYRVAAGFACGAAISFTPFLGFHFAGAALLALFLRGSLLASALGTLVGNPWTFPVIWAWIYTLGIWLLGGSATAENLARLNMQYIIDNPLAVLWHMSVGGILTAVAAWFGFYWPVRRMVAEYHRARRWRIRRKARLESRSGRKGPIVEGQAGDS